MGLAAALQASASRQSLGRQMGSMMMVETSMTGAGRTTQVGCSVSVCCVLHCSALLAGSAGLISACHAWGMRAVRKLCRRALFSKL